MKLAVFSGLCLVSLAAGLSAAVGADTEPAPASDIQIEAAWPSVAGSYLLPAWQVNDVSGSVNRYEKYIVHPQYGYLDRLQLISSRGGFPAWRLTLDRPGQASTAALVRWESPFPRAFAEFTHERNHFYLYPDTGRSVRQHWGLAAGSEMNDHNTYVTLRSQHTDVRLAKPGDPVDFGASHLNMEASRRFGSGDLDLGLALREFSDHSGLQPNSHLMRYDFRYIANLIGQSSVGVNYAFSQVNMGGQTPRAQSFGVAANSPVGSNLVASARFDARRQSHAVEKTAYTRSSATTRLNVGYLGVPGLSLRAGYDRHAYERVDLRQESTDTPAWNSVWLSASYRLRQRWQIAAKAQHRANPNPPVSSLSDPLPLVMNLDRSVELRAQGTPTDNTLVYLATSSRFRKNTRRNVEVQMDLASVGGSAQLGRRLSLNADYSFQHMDSRNLPLQGMLADSWVTTLGGSYAITPKLWVDSNYTNYSSSGGQNTDQNLYGLNLRRLLPGGATASLELRRDIYRDWTAPTQSYTANVVGVSGSTRF